MTWVRTDDAAPLHPKFFRAGLSAYGWWHAALSYCNRYLTDGFIPMRDIDLVFPGTLHEDVLCVVEKLVREGALDVAENGYEMHDYLHYQPSRKSVIRLRKERRDAARHGGVISGKKRQALASTKREALASTKREANGELPSLPDPTRPVVKKQTPLPPFRGSDEFETFWQAYPKKKSKGAALRAWTRARPNLDIVLAALKAQRVCRDWTKDGGQYIPHPATYINAAGWLDEVPREDDEE